MASFMKLRRNFLGRALALLSSCIASLITKHITDLSFGSNIISTQNKNPDTKLGLWMINCLSENQIRVIYKEYERELESLDFHNTCLEQFSGLISQDFLIGNTIDIQGIRFSRLEAAMIVRKTSLSLTTLNFGKDIV